MRHDSRGNREVVKAFLNVADAETRYFQQVGAAEVEIVLEIEQPDGEGTGVGVRIEKGFVCGSSRQEHTVTGEKMPIIYTGKDSIYYVVVRLARGSLNVAP